YLDREGAAARPSLLPVDEGLHRGIAADRRRHLACLLDRRAAHRIGNGVRGDLLTVACPQRVVDVLEDAALNAPALEHGKRLIGHVANSSLSKPSGPNPVDPSWPAPLSRRGKCAGASLLRQGAPLPSAVDGGGAHPAATPILGKANSSPR